MTGERFAVIDLGSNTFHLLISEANEQGSWSAIYKERIYVKLASRGLGRIDHLSAARGMEAMQHFAEKLFYYGVKQTRSIGTAALREANNGREIADQFTSETGLIIEIIDGHQEAEYILRGIKSVIPVLDKFALIMDIGGGSVEFILYKDEVIVFQHSYKIGVAILYNQFHHSDPISPDELARLEGFLAEELSELIEILKKTGAYYLIGSSGSFEVINDVLPRLISEVHWSALDIREMKDYLTKVIGTDVETRRNIPEIPGERLDYIVVAYALILYLFNQIPPEKLFYCDFALKEGVMAEMISKPLFRND